MAERWHEGSTQQLWTRADGGWRVHREMWRLDPALLEQEQRTGGSAHGAMGPLPIMPLIRPRLARSTTRQRLSRPPPMGPTAVERTSRRYWAKDIGGAKPGVSTLTVNDVYAAGDLTHLEGDFTVLEGGKTTKGRYIQLWMRDGSSWRIHRGMWWR